MAKIKVRYKGIADERVISTKDLKSLGVEGIDSDLVWNRRNRFAVELETSDKLEEVLRNEGHFRIEQLGGTVEADAADPNKEGDVLVDGNTGATTQAKTRK
jgi:hypothetical protein